MFIKVPAFMSHGINFPLQELKSMSLKSFQKSTGTNQKIMFETRFHLSIIIFIKKGNLLIGKSCFASQKTSSNYNVFYVGIRY